MDDDPKNNDNKTSPDLPTLTKRKRHRKGRVGSLTLYDPSWMPDKAAQLILAGTFEKDVAKAIGVDYSTYFDYKDIYPEFSQAIARAKRQAIPALIEPALLKTAQGFDYTEVDTFSDGSSIVHKRFAHPNVKAQIAALARYDPEYRSAQQSSLSVAIGANLNMRFMGAGGPTEVIEGQVEEADPKQLPEGSPE